jgi:hypothetical protein
MRQVCKTKLITVTCTLFKTGRTGGNRGNGDRVQEKKLRDGIQPLILPALLPSVQRIWDQICTSVGTSLTGGNRGNGDGVQEKKLRDGIRPLILPAQTDKLKDFKQNSPFALLPSVQRILDQDLRISWTGLTGGTEVTKIGFRKRNSRTELNPSSGRPEPITQGLKTDSKTKLSVCSVTFCSTVFSDLFEPLAPVV